MVIRRAGLAGRAAARQGPPSVARGPAVTGRRSHPGDARPWADTGGVEVAQPPPPPPPPLPAMQKGATCMDDW